MGLDLGLTKEVRVSTLKLKEALEKYDESGELPKGRFEGVTPRELLARMNSLEDPECYSTDVKFNVAYWRKANAIFKWFNDHAECKGDSDCDFEVENDEIIALYEICKQLKDMCKTTTGKVVACSKLVNGKWVEEYEDGQILDEPSGALAESLLPTESGFFFGSTEYGEYYLYCIDETIRQLEPLVNEIKEYREEHNGNDDYDVTYRFWASY